jgi:hypothetical protein
VRGGTLDIDADLFAPHENPPDPGQHRQLQRDGDDEVAQKRVLGCVHALMGIKTRATRLTIWNSCGINDLQVVQTSAANECSPVLCQLAVCCQNGSTVWHADGLC